MVRPIIVAMACSAVLACSGESPTNNTATPAETTDTGTPGSPTDAAMTDTAPPVETLDGYWVWKEQVEGGTVTRTITDDDMTWKVGPSGWEGCPMGISCTRYGIHVLYVNATRFHHMHRVTTGSDYQQYGAYTAREGLLTFAREQAYSCAHPRDKSEYVKPATLYARYKRAGADLWITDLADKDPGAIATKWTVYRPTTKADAHNKYDHPFCGEMREGGQCHCLCPSQDVLADYACGTK